MDPAQPRALWALAGGVLAPGRSPAVPRDSPEDRRAGSAFDLELADKVVDRHVVARDGVPLRRLRRRARGQRDGERDPRHLSLHSGWNSFWRTFNVRPAAAGRFLSNTLGGARAR